MLRSLLASRRVVRLAALLAALLVAPSLFAGMAFDDFFQKLRAQGRDPFGHQPLDIFTFCYRWTVPREGITLPASAHVLSLSMDSVEVERIAEDAITVRTGAPFLSELSSQLFRNARDPLLLGERTSFGEIEAHVSETTRNVATGVTFRFSESLGTRGHRFVAWDGGRFVAFELPAIGTRVRVGEDRPAWLRP